MDKEEQKAIRKEIIKKLNRAKKIDAEVRELKFELESLITNYFEEYKADYTCCDSGCSHIDGIYDTILAFVENGEYGGADLWGATNARNGSEFMRNAENWHKNKILK